MLIGLDDCAEPARLRTEASDDELQQRGDFAKRFHRLRDVTEAGTANGGATAYFFAA